MGKLCDIIEGGKVIIPGIQADDIGGIVNILHSS